MAIVAPLLRPLLEELPEPEALSWVCVEEGEDDVELCDGTADASGVYVTTGCVEYIVVTIAGSVCPAVAGWVTT